MNIAPLIPLASALPFAGGAMAIWWYHRKRALIWGQQTAELRAPIMAPRLEVGGQMVNADWQRRHNYETWLYNLPKELERVELWRRRAPARSKPHYFITADNEHGRWYLVGLHAPPAPHGIASHAFNWSIHRHHAHAFRKVSAARGVALYMRQLGITEISVRDIDV